MIDFFFPFLVAFMLSVVSYHMKDVAEKWKGYGFRYTFYFLNGVAIFFLVGSVLYVWLGLKNLG